MSLAEPAAWLTANRHLLPPGSALDVACGRGRHALWLAEQGWRVEAVDLDASALQAVSDEAARRGLVVGVRQMDLEAGDPLPWDEFDVVVVVHYLHRPLFPRLVASLRPGGVLVYETFTLAQAARGRPTNPDFLLRPGELGELVQPLEVLAWREGDFEGREVSGVVARRPHRPTG